ncbi:zinc finger, CCHC-type containing protein [Tanacetum coccineum]
MVAAAMKHMASNFAKLDKFEGVDFRRWQKKMHFLLSSMSVVYVLTTPMPEDGGDNPTVEQVRKRAKWDNDDYVCRGLILNGMSDPLFDIYQNVESSKELWDSLEAKYMAEDASSKKFLVSNFTNYKMTDSRPVLEQYNELLGILGRFTQHKMNMDEAIQVSCIIDKLPPSWKDFKHTLKHKKEELTLVELGSHLRIKEFLRVQDNDKPKSNNVDGPSVVNMVEYNNSSRYNDNKGKRKHHDNTRVDPNKKAKPTCWKCGKTGHIKRDCKGVNVGNKANGSGTKGSVDGSSNSLKGQNMFNKSLQVYYVTYVSEAYFVQDDDVAWWVDSGATVHVCKDRCWFKTYESLNDGSILHMGNESTALVHGRGCVDLRFSSGKIVLLFNVLHVPNIRKNLVSSSVLNNCGYKQVIESNKFVLSKHGVFIGFGYLSNHMFRLNIVNDNIGSAFMSTSKLNDSILWHARLGHVHFKRMQDMSKDGLIPAFDMDTEKAVVRLPDPQLKNLGERGIECIFVRYAEHSKAFMFFVIEPNDSVLVNLIIESRDAIFDKNIFSSVPRPSLKIPTRTEGIGGSMVPEEVTEEVVQQPEPELRKGKRNRTPKNFRPEFQLYLIKGTRDEVSDQHSYCFNVEDDPKIFDKAMKSPDVPFWKEAINDEMDSIMGNNTWVLADLPPGIDYFDTYAPVARISTIRLLIAMASIHSLIIHQMDVKTAFLNGELDGEAPKQWHQKSDEVVLSNGYLMNQDFLSSRFFMKDMREADVHLGIRIKHESNGIAISQSYYIEKAVSQLKYSRVIGYLMYDMTYTWPDIAFVVGKLSRYTSNPGTQHWQAIQRVRKYLKKTMDYRLIYIGYPSVLEGYIDAS